MYHFNPGGLLFFAFVMQPTQHKGSLLKSVGVLIVRVYVIILTIVSRRTFVPSVHTTGVMYQTPNVNQQCMLLRNSGSKRYAI
jgi:hypothetical protein